MSQAATSTRFSPDEFLARDDHDRFELVDGELEQLSMSVLSSIVGATVVRLLGNHCASRDLGWVSGADLYLRCFAEDRDRLRKPDASYFRRERLAETDLEAGVYSTVPDLVVEVVSKNDLASDVETKVDEYLDAGVPLVWVIDPISRVVRVHRADGTTSRLHDADSLSGETILPGFACRVTELFPRHAGKS